MSNPATRLAHLVAGAFLFLALLATCSFDVSRLRASAFVDSAGGDADASLLDAGDSDSGYEAALHFPSDVTTASDAGDGSLAADGKAGSDGSRGGGGGESGAGGIPSSGGDSGSRGSGGIAGSGTWFDGGGLGGSQVGTGGVVGLGGSGGVVRTGGMVATGGIATGGISTGGIVATGGVQATGGIVATGGITTTGGVQSTGGVVTTGGITTTGGVNASGGTGGLTHTGVWKVMLLGDGMSARTCYPQLLAKDFKNQGHTNFQFVGTATISQSCNGTPAVQTEDHAGTRVTNLSSSTIQGWASQKPDIAIMDLGGDDAGDGVSPGDILSAYLSLIGQFRSQNPKVIFFISKVTPKDSSKVPNWGTQVVNLNAQITNAWATKNATATSPIYIIDQWTGFSTSADTSDGVLPDMSGAQKMADNACAAVAAHNYF